MRDVVSIVVPVYNVENFLDRCVQSIVSQTYPFLEILLIDDGSTDACRRLCDDWAEKDSRIRVIHKNNAGLGMARNTGLEHATGKYVLFVDSDDYILPHSWWTAPVCAAVAVLPWAAKPSSPVWTVPSSTVTRLTLPS